MKQMCKVHIRGSGMNTFKSNFDHLGNRLYQPMTPAERLIVAICLAVLAALALGVFK